MKHTKPGADPKDSRTKRPRFSDLGHWKSLRKSPFFRSQVLFLLLLGVAKWRESRRRTADPDLGEMAQIGTDFHAERVFGYEIFRSELEGSFSMRRIIAACPPTSCS